jgi:5-hydroxyisourate hydrolase
MAGGLSAAVIDTVRGAPATGMLIDLFRLEHGRGQRHHLRTVESAAPGMTAASLITGEEMQPGTYELLFHVGRYFKAQRVPLGESAVFSEVIPVRLVITETARAHQLTLLAGPNAYCVYRS